MTRLGSYKGEEVVRAFQRAGWKITRQRGSHVILEKEGYEATLSIPVMSRGRQKIRIPNPHVGDIDASLLKEILRQAGISEAFLPVQNELHFSRLSTPFHSQSESSLQMNNIGCP